MFSRTKPSRPSETSSSTASKTEAPAEAATTPLDFSDLPDLTKPTPTPAPEPAAAPEPAPVAATPAARPVSAAARPRAGAFLGSDLTFTGTLAGTGGVHIGGTFEGDIRVHDVTVGAGGRVEGVITARRVEVLGRVQGGVVADEVKVRINAEVNGEVTSESFSLDPGARFEGQSRRKPR